MATSAKYFHQWKLKLSENKTVTTAFYFNDEEAKCQINEEFKRKHLPNYFEVMLNELLTYRCHLDSLGKELILCIALLRRMAGTNWEAGTDTSRAEIPSLVHFVAEYCVPARCARSHNELINVQIKNALQSVPECLQFTCQSSWAVNLPSNVAS